MTVRLSADAVTLGTSSRPLTLTATAETLAAQLRFDPGLKLRILVAADVRHQRVTDLLDICHQHDLKELSLHSL